MSNETVKTLHYQRQFLMPENLTDRYWDESTCRSFVFLGTAPDEIELEAELVISDQNSTVRFDGTRDDNYDAHLAAITKLMEQVIAYRQAYAEALAIIRGQGITRGGDVVVTLADG